MQYNKHSISSHLRKALCVLGSIIFAVACNAAVANAQTGTTETRARRAPAVNPDAAANALESTATVMDEVPSNPKPAKTDKTSGGSNSTTDQVKPDRVSVLRDQIRNAKTEVERIRLQRTLVDYLIALGRRSEAAVELRSMLSAENLDAASFYNIGNGLARLGDSEQAVVAYHKAIEVRQGNYARALNNMGVVLLDLGRLDEAYDAFVLAIKQQNFRYAEASYNLGKLYAARDEADLAISEWTRALTVQTDHIDAAVALARAYAVTGKRDRALEVIDVTLKRTGANDRLETARNEIASISSNK